MGKDRQRIFRVVAALGLATLCTGTAGAATPGDSAASAVAPAGDAKRVAFWGLRSLGVPDGEVGRLQKALVAAATTVAAREGLTLLDPEAVASKVRSAGDPELAACDGAMECLGEVARVAGAGRIIAGEIGGFGGSYVVNINLVTDAGRVERRDALMVDKAESLSEGSERLLVRLLAPDSFVGTVELTVDTPEARIYLDGAEVGAAPLKAPVKATVGKHAVRVTHPAHRDFVRWVDVAYGERTAVNVELKRYAAVSGDLVRTGDGPRGGGARFRTIPWYRRWYAITALGVVLAGAAAGITFALARPRYDCVVTVGDGPVRGRCR